jgi:glucose-6-phosphate 1-epimerase
MTLDELNKQFAIPGAVSFSAGPAGLPMVVLTGKGGEAHVMLHGAHVIHYQPAGQSPVLWMSQKSWFAADKPIRGGVPICFPWFGQSSHIPNAPNHGVVRLRDWEFISARVLPDGRVQAVLATRSDEWTRQYWPHEFVLKFTVTVGATLTMSLNTTNIDRHLITVTEALHTYFSVLDIRQVKLHGLEGLDYLDTVGGAHRLLRQDDAPITFAGETDRNYLRTDAATEIEDPGLGRRIAIAKAGSYSTVVWNPWVEKAARMPDFGDDEWPGMLCVETANIGHDAVTIEPGKSHTMEATISARTVKALGA